MKQADPMMAWHIVSGAAEAIMSPNSDFAMYARNNVLASRIFVIP